MNTMDKHGPTRRKRVLKTRPARLIVNAFLCRLQTFHPQNWRVYVRWVGFGLTDGTLPAASASAQTSEGNTASLPVRMLRTFDLPKMRVRLSWVGLDSTSRVDIWAWSLFLLSLGVFAFTRLVALDQFPINFFSDEAIQAVHAAELLRRGLRDADNQLLPVYFQNGMFWNLSLSVYIHALSVKLFGVSLITTRATSALIALSGAVAVSLILKWIFQLRWWWLGALV